MGNKGTKHVIRIKCRYAVALFHAQFNKSVMTEIFGM